MRGYSRAELREEGLIYSVDVRLRGSLGDTLYLRYRLYRSEGAAMSSSSTDGRFVNAPLPTGGRWEPRRAGGTLWSASGNGGAHIASLLLRPCVVTRSRSTA